MPAIPAGSAYHFRFHAPGTGPFAEVMVEVDPLDKVAEDREDNNTTSGSVGRRSDLAVTSLSIERQPSVGGQAQLVATIRDLLASPQHPPAATELVVSVDAELRTGGPAPIPVDHRRTTIPRFTAQHYLPVTVPLTADQASAAGSPYADLAVRICADPGDAIAEVEDACGDDAGCNNCVDHLFRAVDLTVPMAETPPAGQPGADMAAGPAAAEQAAAEQAAAEAERRAAAEQAAAEQAAAEQAAAEQAAAEAERQAAEQAAAEQAAAEAERQAAAEQAAAETVADAASEPVEAPAAPPDLVPAGLSLSPSIAGGPNTLTVNVTLLSGRLQSGRVAVEVTHAGWASDEHFEGSAEVGELAGRAQFAVQLDGFLRPSPGRCGPTLDDYTMERFIIRVVPDASEKAADLDGNNSRELTLRLACHTTDDALGLGPFPDPAIASAQPYIAHDAGHDYLRFFVSLYNLGTPVRADSIHIDLVPGERSWLPTSWRDGATGVYRLDPSVIGEALNGLPPRRAHACGLGGYSLPLDDLPDFARTATPGRPVGTDNSLKFTVELSLSQPIRQRDVDNDELALVVPLDRGLPDAADTPCGGRPERFGIERARLQSLLPDVPAASPASPAARISTERLPDGSVELRGELWQTAPGPAVDVPYAWLRDGTWAGGGFVDVPADAPAVVRARHPAASTATWELVVDPDHILPGDQHGDNRAHVTVKP